MNLRVDLKGFFFPLLLLPFTFLSQDSLAYEVVKTELGTTLIFSDSGTAEPLQTSLESGFLSTIVSAYSNQIPLEVRPDDVWLTISAVVGRYLEATSKDDEYMNEPELKRFFAPEFSTTTSRDLLIGSAQLIGNSQAYFRVKMLPCRGLPKVTLKGTLQDWIHLREKADYIKALGGEAQAWYTVLVPVLDQFIATYEGKVSDEFWEFIPSLERMETGDQVAYSGWFLVFAPFTDSGRYLLNTPKEITETGVYSKDPAGVEEVDISWEDSVITPVEMPAESLVANAFERIDYSDAFQTTLPTSDTRDLETLTKSLFQDSPGWTGTLMAIRDQIVGLFGLKTHQLPSKEALNQMRVQPGDSFGLFQVFRRSSNEVLLGADDRHLNFRLSLHTRRERTGTVATLSTVVAFKSNWGRLYFRGASLFHSRVVQSMLRGLSRPRR